MAIAGCWTLASPRLWMADGVHPCGSLQNSQVQYLSVASLLPTSIPEGSKKNSPAACCLLFPMPLC